MSTTESQKKCRFLCILYLGIRNTKNIKEAKYNKDIKDIRSIRDIKDTKDARDIIDKRYQGYKQNHEY